MNGTDFIDLLEMFLGDPARPKAIMMIGEIGGSAEERGSPVPAKDDAKRRRKKPMAGFIAGSRGPARPPHGARRRHHRGRDGRWRKAKIAAMGSAGVRAPPLKRRRGMTLVE